MSSKPLISILKSARRKCQTCHSHDIVEGYYVRSVEGYDQFRCLNHLMLMLQQQFVADQSATVSPPSAN